MCNPFVTRLPVKYLFHGAVNWNSIRVFGWNLLLMAGVDIASRNVAGGIWRIEFQDTRGPSSANLQSLSFPLTLKYPGLWNLGYLH